MGASSWAHVLPNRMTLICSTRGSFVCGSNTGARLDRREDPEQPLPCAGLVCRREFPEFCSCASNVCALVDHPGGLFDQLLAHHSPGYALGVHAPAVSALMGRACLLPLLGPRTTAPSGVRHTSDELPAAASPISTMLPCDHLFSARAKRRASR